MANGWQRCTKGRRPCEICGKANGWCQVHEDGLRCCMTTGGLPAAGWDLVSAKVNKQGHLAAYYRDLNDPKPAGGWKPDPEKEAARKAEEERQREKAAGRARALWQMCVRQDRGNHRLARAYFAGRGIPLDRLPGGELPRTLRYHPALVRDEVERVDEWTDPDGRKRSKTIYRDPKPMYPAIVGRGTRAKARANPHPHPHPPTPSPITTATIPQGTMAAVRCVQRIYLEVDGERVGKIGHGEAKKCLGPTGGAAVRLSGADEQGVLVLCEGLETGVALLAALGRPDGSVPAVWACISTSGLLTADVSDCLGWCTRIIIAADHDHVDRKINDRPGTFSARMARNVLARTLHAAGWNGSLAIADPDHLVAPEMVREDGYVLLGQSFDKDQAIEGKSVDWLDVVATKGAEAAGRLVLEAAGRDVVVVGEGGGDGVGAPPGPPAPPRPPTTPPGTPSGDGARGGDGPRVVSLSRHSIAQALLEERGMRVLLVEDLVTTGGSSLSGVEALRDAGSALSDDALGQLFFHFEELVAFTLQHLIDRHAGPARDDLRHMVGGHRLVEEDLL